MQNQTAIEPDLLYPLIRGRDIKRWRAEPSAYIIITHLPGMRLNAISGNEMKAEYPKTYLYLKRFENVLRERAVFKRYFTRRDKKTGKAIETGPFYLMFDVGDYTFADYKVVWTWISKDVRVAVISSISEKPICLEHNTSFVACKNLKEAYYICALLNSVVGNFTIRTFYSGGSGGIASPHVLQNIRIPKFDPKNKLHTYLAELSIKTHKVAKTEDREKLRDIEEEVDQVSAKIWGLTKEELKEIKQSLKEIR